MMTFIASSQSASVYGTANIKVLKRLEAVRKRPGMYIGDTADGTGLHNMIFEVVDLALGEALAGFATEVSVTLNADGSASIRDDGRGMRTGVDPDDYIVPSGFNGAGVSVVNALSTHLDLRIWRDGKEHMVRFRDGVAEGPLAVVGPAVGRHGTEFTFWPCREAFHNVIQFDFATLESGLRDLAFLTPGVRMVLKDDRVPGGIAKVMRYPNGAADYVRELARSRPPLIDAPIIIAGEADGIRVEVALWWTDSAHEQVECFANGVPQRKGGTHLTGFHAAFCGVFERYARSQGDGDNQKAAIIGDDARIGLAAVLSIWAGNARFTDGTKRELVYPEMKWVMESVVSVQLAAWLDAHPKQAQAILAKARKTASGRAICGFVQRSLAARP